MEEEEDKVVDMDKTETMDADEYKQAMDMCKDMGYESISDALTAHKEMKSAKDKEEDPDKTKDKDKEEKEDKKEKKETNDSLNIKGFADVEVQIAKLKDTKVRDQAIVDFAKFKDTMKGYVASDKDLAEELITAVDVKVKDEELPEFANYAEIVMDNASPHKK